jgi:hypothetical protein
LLIIRQTGKDGHARPFLFAASGAIHLKLRDPSHKLMYAQSKSKRISRVNEMMTLFFRLCFAIMLFAKMVAVQAEPVTWCVDKDGRKTFTNVNVESKGVKCRTLNLGPVTVVQPVQAEQLVEESQDSPKVGGNARKERDNDWRRIQENELKNELDLERANLERAVKELAELEDIRKSGERNYQNDLNRIEPYKNKVALHECNIAALEKELARANDWDGDVVFQVRPCDIAYGGGGAYVQERYRRWWPKAGGKNGQGGNGHHQMHDQGAQSGNIHRPRPGGVVGRQAGASSGGGVGVAVGGAGVGVHSGTYQGQGNPSRGVR